MGGVENWQYLVFLNKDKCEVDSSNRPLVYFDNQPRVITQLNFQFYTQQPLTYQQILNKLTGTKGVEIIAGQFKIEE